MECFKILVGFIKCSGNYITFTRRHLPYVKRWNEAQVLTGRYKFHDILLRSFYEFDWRKTIEAPNLCSYTVTQSLPVRCRYSLIGHKFTTLNQYPLCQKIHFILPSPFPFLHGVFKYTDLWQKRCCLSPINNCGVLPPDGSTSKHQVWGGKESMRIAQKGNAKLGSMEYTFTSGQQTLLLT